MYHIQLIYIFPYIHFPYQKLRRSPNLPFPHHTAMTGEPYVPPGLQQCLPVDINGHHM